VDHEWFQEPNHRVIFLHYAPSAHLLFSNVRLDELCFLHSDDQQDHVWFWEPNLPVRTLAMMIPIYHDIVGRGMVMELAFSIDRDGLVEDTHAVVYKQVGDWVRACYGSPLASTSGAADTTMYLTLHPGDTIDRVQLREDTVSGQRVRNYTVAVSNSTAAVRMHDKNPAV
jgi:hypothetical protein